MIDTTLYPIRDAEHAARYRIALEAAERAGLDVVPVVDVNNGPTAAFDIVGLALPDGAVTVVVS